MNGLPRSLLAFGLLAALAGGCSKKAPGGSKAETSQGEKAATPPVKSKAKAPEISSAPATPGPAAPERGPIVEAPAVNLTPGAPEQAPLPPELAAEDAKFDAWFKKYHLDFSDPKMLDDDPDGDGFSNREEFMANTDPHDPKSHPGLASGMRLKEYVQKDLPYVLRSVQAESAKIEREEGGAKRTETVKPGQTLPGTSYKVAKLRPPSEEDRDKDGNRSDASSVTLYDAATKERVVLRKDLPARSGGSYAVIVSPDGAQKMTVHQDETFTWPGPPSATYRVQDLREEQVILQDVATGKTITVPKGP